jgi:L-lactate dehydrogenase (cytochrome)/(S)-mandelate dehydrogenase
VAHVLNILKEEIARTMTLMGVDRLEDLDESWLIPAHRVVQDEYYSGHMTSVSAHTGG